MATTLAVPADAALRLERWYGQLPREVRVLHGSLFGRLFGATGQHAVTINGTVHWTRHAPALETTEGTVLLGHELFHVEQQRRMGWWSFLVRYIWHWRPRHVRRGWEHPYEVPAYARGREISEALRTA